MVASNKHFNRSTASYLDDPMVDLNNLGIGEDCSGRNDEEEILQIQKGPWGPDEDRRLRKHVEMNGETNWGVIAEELNRTAKSCRLRWTNQLSPNINRKPFTPEEDEIITRIVCTRGGKWSQISKILQGRTDNQVKNRWNSNLVKYHSKTMPKSGNPSGKSSQPACNKLKVSRLGAKSLSAPLRASARVSSGIGVQAPPPWPGACLPNSFMPPCFVAAHPEESLKYAPPATLSALAAPAPFHEPVFNNLDGFSLCPPGQETDDVLDPHLFPYTAPTRSLLL